MQQFSIIPESRTLQESLYDLLNNDKSVLSSNSGTTFPTANLQVGMACYRTDQQKLYTLKSVEPEVWGLQLDLSGASAIVAEAMVAVALKTPRAINTVNFDGSADITVDPRIDRDDTTNATRYIAFVDNATAGFKRLKMDNGLSYNPSTNTLTASVFKGALDGNAATATRAAVATAVSLGATMDGTSEYLNFTWPPLLTPEVAPVYVWCVGPNGATDGRAYAAAELTVKRATSAGTVDALKAAEAYSALALTVSGATSRLQIAGRDNSGQNWQIYTNANILRFFSSTANAERMNIDASGNFTAVGNVTGYSDERLKTNWRNFNSNLIDKLAAVKNGVYDRKDTGETQVGVSAQSLRAAMPEAVIESEEGVLSVAYGNAALAAVVELAREVQGLRARVTELESRG